MTGRPLRRTGRYRVRDRTGRGKRSIRADGARPVQDGGRARCRTSCRARGRSARSRPRPVRPRAGYRRGPRPHGATCVRSCRPWRVSRPYPASGARAHRRAVRPARSPPYAGRCPHQGRAAGSSGCGIRRAPRRRYARERRLRAGRSLARRPAPQRSGRRRCPARAASACCRSRYRGRARDRALQCGATGVRAHRSRNRQARMRRKGSGHAQARQRADPVRQLRAAGRSLPNLHGTYTRRVSLLSGRPGGEASGPTRDGGRLPALPAETK